MIQTFRVIGKRVFYGWWIVALGSLINAVGVGIIYHSFTVFFLPLKRDLGVSSAAIFRSGRGQSFNRRRESREDREDRKIFRGDGGKGKKVLLRRNR